MTDTDKYHKQKRITELAEGNERSYAELIETLAPRPFNMDTSDVRRELFIEFLEKWGVITEEQRLDYEIAFHEKVEEALNGVWEQVRQQKQPKLSVVKKPSKLLDAQGRPLT